MKRMRVKDHGARRRWGMFVSRESHATKFLGKAKTLGGSWMGGKSDVAQIAAAILKLKFGSLGCQSQIWHEQRQLHWSSCFGCNATWPEIRNLLRRETESAVSGLSGVLSGFEMDEQTRGKMLADLEDYARGVKAREEAGRVLMRMKDRFATLFSRDSDSMPRVWTRKENVRAIIETARSSSLKLLSVMAAIRLDDDADNIENTLSAALVESGSNTVTSTSTMSVDPLASSTWEEVPSSKTLITPVQCICLWSQFETETGYTVAQAIAAQETDPGPIFDSKTVKVALAFALSVAAHFGIAAGLAIPGARAVLLATIPAMIPAITAVFRDDKEERE